MFRKGLSVVPCTYLTEYVAKLFLSENSKSLFVQFSKERNSMFSSGLSSICSSKVSLSIGAQTNQPNTQLTQPTFRLEPDQLGHELALFNLQQKAIILCFPVLLLAFCKLAPHICHLLTTSPPATGSDIWPLLHLVARSFSFQIGQINSRPFHPTAEAHQPQVSSYICRFQQLKVHRSSLKWPIKTFKCNLLV